MTYSTQFLNKTVTVKIDKPLGTKHSKTYDLLYTQNYGHIPGVLAPDGEELDAYVLGIFEPLTQFTGTCIAVIHRTNDEDDKLVIVPEGVHFSDKQIQKLTYFQEQFFESVIIKEDDK
jgi:inorganic pyrophosphatase